VPFPTGPAAAALRELGEEVRSSGWFGEGRGRRSACQGDSWRVGIEVGSGLGSEGSIEVALAVAVGIAVGFAMRFGFAGIDWESACCWDRRQGSASRSVRVGEMLQCSLGGRLERRNDCALLGEIEMWWRTCSQGARVVGMAG